MISMASAVASTSSMARARMLRYGLVRISSARPVAARASARQRMELVAGEDDPRRRPEQVWPAGAIAGLEGVRPGDLRFLEFGQPVGGGDVEAVARHDPALVHRVLGRVAERHQPGLAMEVRRLEAGHQVHGLAGDVEGLGHLAADRRDLAAPEGPREAPDPDGDRVDGSPADQLDQLVAGLLEGQPGLDRRTVVLGQLERAGVAQEVGQVEEVDVQRVALDPLAAVHQPAQRADLRVDFDPQAVLEGMDRGHLVGDRADPADAGDDVDDLVRRPADDQLLEVARRLEDLEPGLLDDAVPDPQAKRSLAFDAGHHGDVDRQVAAPASGQVEVMHRVSPRARRAAAGRRWRR